MNKNKILFNGPEFFTCISAQEGSLQAIPKVRATKRVLKTARYVSMQGLYMYNNGPAFG